jgi:hypothetical protein
VTILDVDAPAQNLTVTVTMSPASTGEVTAPAFTVAGTGTWTFTGTAAAGTAALRAMTFAPTDVAASVYQTACVRSLAYRRSDWLWKSGLSGSSPPKLWPCMLSNT